MPGDDDNADSQVEISSLLDRLSKGEREVEHLLLPRVYDELRRIARRQMRRERPDHTFQPTALVHQAYVRLVGTRPIACHSRNHFLALAARAMRHVLADHAIARNAERRGGGGCRVTLDDALLFTEEEPLEGIFLNRLLTQLGELDERQARIVELKVMAGMTYEEIASVIGISSRQVRRDWSMARAWLHQQVCRAS